MRQLLTIFHYELLLQFKSVRFKATCLLAGLIAFGFYNELVRNQELQPLQNSLLAFESFPTYLIAIVITGLFSIGRIRAAGMHPILMTKPFPTFALLLGQLLAGLITLLVPLFILFFSFGILGRWQYEIDFPFMPLLYIMLFFMIPLICCVLAATIWVRTCFKNNLVAIVILAILFFAIGFFANKYLTTRGTGSNDGQVTQIHRFVPMASYLCEDYWKSQMSVLDQPQVSFTRREDWINLLASIFYCNVFLMLGGYHLRRTEPQRKVLGAYGRRWFHTPTFLRMACDLKIDPNVTWRHHLVLLGMLGFIFYRTAVPMIPDEMLSGRRAAAAQPGDTTDARYDPKKFPASRILKIRIFDDVQLMTPDRYHSEMTVAVDGDTSGTMAILRLFYRSQYDLRSLTLDGTPLHYKRVNEDAFIDGQQFKLFADGHRHKMVFEAERSTTQQSGSAFDLLVTYFNRGYSFVESKLPLRDDDGKRYEIFSWEVKESWPVNLTLIAPRLAQIISAPVTPEVRQEGKFTRYHFEIPPDNIHNIRYSTTFAPQGGYAILDASDKRLKFAMAVPDVYESVARDLLELAEPVLHDFHDLYHFAPESQTAYISPRAHDVNPNLMKEIRKYRNIYRYRGYLYNYEEERLGEALKTFEKSILYTAYNGAGMSHFNNWDKYSFFAENFTKGLNHRISRNRQYEPPEFTPVSAHLEAKAASPLQRHTREEMMEIQSHWPVFQMLYLALGRETWLAMLGRLQRDPATGRLTPEILQRAAEGASGQKLAWFFDYWLRDGLDLPCYRIDSASAKLGAPGADNQTQYNVKAVIQNCGTGRMPVPLRLKTVKSAIDEKLWIGSGETVTWTVTCHERPQEVSVDPDGWILTKPYWVETNKTWTVTANAAVKIE